MCAGIPGQPAGGSGEQPVLRVGCGIPDVLHGAGGAKRGGGQGIYISFMMCPTPAGVARPPRRGLAGQGGYF